MIGEVKPFRKSVSAVTDIVGEWGKWQFSFTSFYFIQWIVGALNNIGYTFHAYNNDYWCSDVPQDYPVYISFNWQTIVQN